MQLPVESNDSCSCSIGLKQRANSSGMRSFTKNDYAPPPEHQLFTFLDGVQWFVCVNPESKLGCLRNLGTPSVTNRNGAFGIIFSGTKASVSSRLHVKHWIFKQMLSPKTMWPACCGMAVDASCWSINMVWSPISKLSRATC